MNTENKSIQLAVRVKLELVPPKYKSSESTLTAWPSCLQKLIWMKNRWPCFNRVAECSMLYVQLVYNKAHSSRHDLHVEWYS